MKRPVHELGIVGQLAPAWSAQRWVDAQGRPRAPLTLSNLSGRWKILFCFQSWCPGCHSHGAPTMRALVQGLAGQDSVALLAVQTVFEGFEVNTYDAMLGFQAEQRLSIPFAHDPGDAATGLRSDILMRYRTGGTPWFIVIDPQDRVVFNDFHVDADGLVRQVAAAPGVDSASGEGPLA